MNRGCRYDPAEPRRILHTTRPYDTDPTPHRHLSRSKGDIKPYHIPEAKREEITTEVRKMLELGVIEESHSQWSSPIVLVPKLDGSLRFCNDFRKLNKVSQFDAYPIPCIDELVDQLGKAR
ncbi:unnamed protein product [Eretmochelys imbricata]